MLLLWVLNSFLDQQEAVVGNTPLLQRALKASADGRAPQPPQGDTGSTPICREVQLSPETHQQDPLLPCLPKELLQARPQPCARAEMGNTRHCSSTHERKSLGFIALTAWHAHILLKASQGTQIQKGSGQAQPTDCTSSRFAMFYSSTSHQITAAARGTGVHGGGNKGALDGVLRQL